MMAKAPGGGGAREQDEDLDERLQRLRMA